MPGGDRRGPEGRGPMTGRGSGGCIEGKDGNLFGRPRRGMGFGRGNGRGRGFGFSKIEGHRSDQQQNNIENRGISDENMELKEKVRSLEEELQRTIDELPKN